MPALLAPYRVLDLTDATGSACGRILADLGAGVIKIEPPGGDPDRRIGPFYHDTADEERSLHWFSHNLNKKSITLDITSTDGQELFRRLVIHAGFLIESFPPTYLDRLGLGYSHMASLNPSLIYVSITHSGQSGPCKDHAGCDIVDSSIGGLTYTCGDVDRAPVRISEEQSCLQASAHAAGAALIAHQATLATGSGQHIDVSIQEAMAWTTMYTIPYWHTAGMLFPRSGNLQTRYGSTYRLMFPCKDGHVSVRAYTGVTFGPWQSRLVKAMQREGMAEDLVDVDWPSLSFEEQPQNKIDHWEEVMGRYFLRHTRAELHEIARECEFGLYPSNTPEDILNYRQLQERGFWMEVPYPELGDTLHHTGPMFTTSPALQLESRRAPLIGEHNLEIYRDELGMTTSELIALRGAGVI